MYSNHTLPGRKFPTPESASLFGFVPTASNPKGMLSSVICLGNFFRGSFNLGNDVFRSRQVVEKDVCFYQARLHPKQDLDYYKKYFEIFCAPLLPSRIGPHILDMFIPSKELWSSYFENHWGIFPDGSRVFLREPVKAGELDQGRSIVEQEAKRVVFFSESSQPFYRFEFDGSILGSDLYLLVSMIRAPYENYEMIDALFRAKDAGLNLSQCWFYASAYCAWWYHQFIEQQTILHSNLSKLPAFDLAIWIEKDLKGHSWPIFKGGKSGYIWSSLNDHLAENKVFKYDNHTYHNTEFMKYSDGSSDNTVLAITRPLGEKFLEECLKYNAKENKE